MLKGLVYCSLAYKYEFNVASHTEKYFSNGRSLSLGWYNWCTSSFYPAFSPMASRSDSHCQIVKFMLKKDFELVYLQYHFNSVMYFL